MILTSPKKLKRVIILYGQLIKKNHYLKKYLDYFIKYLYQ